MSATHSSMSKKIQFQGLSSSAPIGEGEEQETMLLHKKQGIASVLGSDFNRDRTPDATSLRRTLSGDMSSKKRLSLDSFSSSSSDEEEEEEEERFQIWSSIQRDKKDQRHHDDGDNPPPAKLDTWSSILFDKAKEENSNDSVTPYIHPLVKRSKSALSEKSFEICTESLGSETGSDHVLSSDNSNSSPSETEDSEQDDKEEQQHEEVELQVPKQNLHHVVMKKSMPRCFPPPLPSLHMRSHRDGNGRLFLEAVTIAAQNNSFCAQRQDGRLVLTFASDEEEEKDEVDEELEEEFMGFEIDDDNDVEEGRKYEEDENYDEGEEEEDDEVVEVEAVMEEEPLLSSGVITSNVHRLALMVNKPIGVVNKNTKKWSEKFNEVVNFEEQQHGLVAQSIPPRPKVVARLIPSAPALAPVASYAAGPLNAYDCYWGTNHTSKVEQNKYSSVLVKNNDRCSKVIFYGDANYWNSNDGDQQKLVVMRGKNGDYLIHKAKSCKDSRRSFLFWEPRCIAA